MKQRLCERTAVTLRILALLGSPHKNGPTASLLRAFLERSPAGAEAETVDTFAERTEPCDGCLTCGKTYGCVKNRAGDVFGKIERADALVVATPVYLLSFPAPLKAVFDRFEQYYAARFMLGKKPAIKKPKQAFLIITQGSAGGRGPDIIFEQSKTAFSVMNTTLADSFVFRETDDASENSLSAAREELKRHADRFFVAY